MLRSTFDTLALPTDRRWPAWRQTLAEFAIDTHTGGDANFAGRLQTCAAPSGLSFTLLESTAPQSMSAMRGLVGEVFWMALILSGQSVLDLNGVPAPMASGDILFGKKGAPCTLEISTEFRMLLVNIPASLVQRKVLVPLPRHAIHVRGGSGMGRILSGLLSAVAASMDELDETLVGTVEAALPPFMQTCVFNQTGELALAGTAAMRAGVLQRIWRTIEDQLDDAELSISCIAAQHGLSVRYIQKLFEEGGENFSRYVRRRRLEQIRSDLANPVNRDVSITETCFRWGFNDSATFSRAFRAEFGVSPREYRRDSAAPSVPASRRGRLVGLARLDA
jgi:AraC-like DNA-binding protein